MLVFSQFFQKIKFFQMQKGASGHTLAPLYLPSWLPVSCFFAQTQHCQISSQNQSHVFSAQFRCRAILHHILGRNKNFLFWVIHRFAQKCSRRRPLRSVCYLPFPLNAWSAFPPQKKVWSETLGRNKKNASKLACLQDLCLSHNIHYVVEILQKLGNVAQKRTRNLQILQQKVAFSTFFCKKY